MSKARRIILTFLLCLIYSVGQSQTQAECQRALTGRVDQTRGGGDKTRHKSGILMLMASKTISR